jgi:dTDP-4-amino-4,6-dideoxygalactose transaminase
LQRAAKHLGYEPGSFPVAERQAQRILSLPVYPELEESHLRYIVKAIRDFFHER